MHYTRGMQPERATVFLPCHTLDDFPTWLEEAEADDLLAAWTAAWHPALVAAVGGPPTWASVDLPPPAGPLLGIVPASWDDRFAAQFDATATGSNFVRRVTGADAIARAAAAAIGCGDAETPLPGDARAADFEALGLATLLAELLARRMRSEADLDSTGFPAAVATAANAAVDGRTADCDASLREAFDCLTASRGRYYPVDSYVVDLVLLARGSRADAIRAAIDSSVPVAVAATGDVIAALAASQPDAIATLRTAAAAGRLGLCGGRDHDGPVDACTPEALLESFRRGRSQWHDALGVAPASFARVSGGGSPLLPQVLAGLGCESGLWSLFDGSPLPDVGGGLIRWDAGGAALGMLAERPLDARSARTVLALPDTLGDAMDRHHVAAILFAHYAGTASPWHALVRRIAGWSGLLGTFVTPAELLARGRDSATPVAPEPDAFPPTLPAGEAAAADLVEAAVTAARAEARRVVAATAPLLARLPSADDSAATPPVTVPPQRRGLLPFGFFGGGRDRAPPLVLESALVRAEANPRTGGLLSLARPTDRGNRVSQQLAVRTTRPPGAVGSGWESPEDRALHTRMVADDVTLDAAGPAIVSRGRLVDADGTAAARFTQRLALVAGLPLATIDIDIQLERPLAGPLLENHVAARFAWHENEDVELRRSLHVQSIATERLRFTAPHFVELVPAAARGQTAGDSVAILTAGLPWHVRVSPHVLDSILAGPANEHVTRRFAVGIGLARPWDLALALLADEPLEPAASGLPDNVRLTVDDAQSAGGGAAGEGAGVVRIGLIESAGRAGSVRVDWGRPVARAVAVDLAGRPRSDVDVTIDGGATAVFLDRYQWLHLELEFAG
jgi:hypothetical protein